MKWKKEWNKYIYHFFIVFIILIILILVLFIISTKRDTNEYKDFTLENIPHCYSKKSTFCWIYKDQNFDNWEYKFMIKNHKEILIIINKTDE